MALLQRSLSLFLATILLPLACALVCLRPRLRGGWRERFGVARVPGEGGFWVHGASLGEMRAARPLIQALQREGWRVVASAMTHAGRAALHRELPGVPGFFAPLDHPLLVARALDRVRPKVLIFVETELWPFWIAAAQRRGIAVLVVSGRISGRSFARMRALRALFAPTLRRLSGVGARSALDAERFIQLGADPRCVEVTGDLKRAACLDGAELAPELRGALGEATVFVAGSTHSGEEGVVHSVLTECELRGFPLVGIVVPRHIGRVSITERNLRATGRRIFLRSRLVNERIEPGDVLLVDTEGELTALYGRADIAFVGGTLAEVGGHNLIEPIAARCFALFGPHTQDVAEHVAVAEASGGGLRVENEYALALRAAELVSDLESTRKRALEARRFLEGGDDLERTIEFVRRFYETTG